MGCRDNLVSLRFRHIGYTSVLAVDFDLGDVTPVHEQVTDAGRHPNRLAVRCCDLVCLEPGAHRKVRPLLHVDAKHLLHNGGPLRVRREEIGGGVALEAKGHEAAVPHAFLGSHAHLGAHLFADLLILEGLGGHQERFHEPARGGVAVGRIVNGDELHIVRFKLFVQDVEVAASDQAVIPGADDAIDLLRLHQPAQAS